MTFSFKEFVERKNESEEKEKEKEKNICAKKK